MSAYADLIERLQRVDENECYSNPWSTHRDCNDAAAAISRLEREKAIYREALEAVRDHFGGQARDQDWFATERLVRQALSQEQSA